MLLNINRGTNLFVQILDGVDGSISKSCPEYPGSVTIRRPRFSRIESPLATVLSVIRKVIPDISVCD